MTDNSQHDCHRDGQYCRQHDGQHDGQQDASRYKSLLLQFPYAAHALVFCRDQDYGRVTIDREGRPVLHYWPSRRDQANIMEVCCVCTC